VSRLVELPRLGRLERARLWLSYQRYAILLFGAAAAAMALLVAWTSPWWWAPAALAALVPVRFAVSVLARWPRKLQATRVAVHRLEAGRFSPRQIRAYCGDPCFKLVAAEILRRAGLPLAQRRRLIDQYSEELRRDRSTVVIFDHTSGTVTMIKRT
jgi:hypothetical protein